MSRTPFTVIHLALCLSFGITIGSVWDVDLVYSYAFLSFLVLLYGILLIFIKDCSYNAIWFRVIGYFFMIGVGVFQYNNLTDLQEAPDAFIDCDEFMICATEATHDLERCKYFQTKIIKIKKNGLWYDCLPTNCRAFLQKNSVKTISTGDVFAVSSKVKHFEDNLAKRQAVANKFSNKFAQISQNYYTTYIKESNFNKIGSVKISDWRQRLERVAFFAKETLAKYLYDNDVFAIVAALLLGDKDALTKEIKGRYSDSGTVHVLAVSGLHVGVFYMLTSYLLNLLLFFVPMRSLFSEIFSVLIIWIFAAVSGFSPSVLRATTMFSIISTFRLFTRGVMIYESLGVSAIILLICNPRMLFDIGFQLSYLAVFGIAILAKKISDFLHFKNKVLNHLWSISSVSIAAQLFTLPLILYYFGQFPTYFVFANWIVIPAASVILYLGLAIIALSQFNIVANMLSTFTIWIVNGVNFFLDCVNALPFSVIKDLYIDGWQMIFLSLAIIFYSSFLWTKKYSHIFLSLFCLAIFAVYLLFCVC